MDPDVALQKIKEGIEDGDWQSVQEARIDLQWWVDNGGREPRDPRWKQWMFGKVVE